MGNVSWFLGVEWLKLHLFVLELWFGIKSFTNEASNSPSTANIHRNQRIWQSDFRRICVVYKLVGKEDVIIHTVGKEHSEANHKQQLTAQKQKYGGE